MTKDQYLTWLQVRPADPADWSAQDCREADQLIREVALDNLQKVLKRSLVSKDLIQFVELMVDVHFGAAEVDDLLMALKCYPDWLDKGA